MTEDRSILVIGCGGLGCELLKLLINTECCKIFVIDEDRIERTNLNRQFFFISKDVGSWKAQVVAEKINKMKGRDSVIPIVGSVFDYKSLSFYAQFDVVYNCVDNDETRSFVNQRCLLSAIELVDGGSGGWLGQSFYFSNKKGSLSECFDCIPKNQGEFFPVCTIRQTPKSFKHCLVWAKIVFEAPLDDIDEETYCLKERIIRRLGRKVKNIAVKRFQKKIYRKECVYERKATKEWDFRHNQPLTKDQQIAHNLLKEKIKLVQSKIYAMKEELKEIREVCRIKNQEAVRNGSKKIEGIYKLACKRAHKYSIQPLSFIESETFMKKIIPSVCTTNSIIASLMILSRQLKRSFYLAESKIIHMNKSVKNPNCLSCGLPIYKYVFTDQSLKDLYDKFSGLSLVTRSNIFSKEDNPSLSILDGEYTILKSRSELMYGIYIKKGLSHSCERIR